MKAIILSAGQGSRLMPLTEKQPKCLLDIGDGETVLRWQIRQLESAGVTDIWIVTGFRAGQVDADLSNYRGRARLHVCYNPFYKVADNLGSVWLAIRELRDESVGFLIVNGDTLFTESVARQVVGDSAAAITLAISQKPRYDSDDMKVIREGRRLLQVGKSLNLDEVNGESIGVMGFRGAGIAAFRRMVHDTISTPEGTSLWYLSVLNRLASETRVMTTEVAADDWCEIDFPADYQNALGLVQSWRARVDDVRLRVGSRG